MAAKQVAQRTKRKGSAESRTAASLRKLTDPRNERVFKPKTSSGLVITVVALSIGSVIAGAGAYGLLWGAEGPSAKYAPYLLAVGAGLVLGLSFFGRQMPAPVRVGDAGLAIDNGDEIDRIDYREMTRVMITRDGVSVQAEGRTVFVPAAEHPDAAARLAAEVRARIPSRVDGPADALPAPVTDAGDVRPLEPPQIAGLSCRKSGRAISFEGDARLCGRCGEVYHKSAIPSSCLGCAARLA